ncbi:TPA: hypothetical protein ACHVGK_001137 [Streptococcus suis]
MIVLGSVMTGRKFFEEGLTLEDLDLAHLTKEETLAYLETGLFREREV